MLSSRLVPLFPKINKSTKHKTNGVEFGTRVLCSLAPAVLPRVMLECFSL